MFTSKNTFSFFETPEQSKNPTSTLGFMICLSTPKKNKGPFLEGQKKITRKAKPNHQQLFELLNGQDRHVLLVLSTGRRSPVLSSPTNGRVQRLWRGLLQLLVGCCDFWCLVLFLKGTLFWLGSRDDAGLRVIGVYIKFRALKLQCYSISKEWTPH